MLKCALLLQSSVYIGSVKKLVLFVAQNGLAVILIVYDAYCITETPEGTVDLAPLVKHGL